MNHHGRPASKNFETEQIAALLLFASQTRVPVRNRLIVLLSVKAGLRACEIANLTWDMVLDASGAIGSVIELRDCAAKKQQRPHDPAASRAVQRVVRLARAD